MLASRNRLRTSEVRDIIASGKPARSAHLSVKYVVKQGVFQAAAVVSKKVAKGAVMRNSLRRSLYTALAAHPLPPGTQAVFFIHKIPPTPRTVVFAREISTFFKNI
jgi:ribonuclease P protein component